MTNAPKDDAELREEVRKLEEKFEAAGKPVVVVYRAELFTFAERLSKVEREYWEILLNDRPHS
jgi:hypothetical protein